MRIIKINEKQYKKLLLGEEMHYPKFLDKIKEDITLNLSLIIEENLSNNVFNFQYVMQYSCEYTDNILFDVTIDPDGDVKDKRNYYCTYSNQYNRLLNGKLINPIITINCPSKNKIILIPILKTVLSHELTHLYDDWMALKTGQNGINYNEKNTDSTYLLSANIDNESLYKYLGVLSYMSLKAEKQAFISQTVQELQEIGCSLSNYRQKIKETIMYKNITKGYNNVMDMLEKVTDNELDNCNKYVLTVSPKANIPKLNISDFNANKYRLMLIKWAENVYHNTIKSYGSVVQYYIDNLQEQKNKTTSMFIC